VCFIPQLLLQTYNSKLAHKSSTSLCEIARLETLAHSKTNVFSALGLCCDATKNKFPFDKSADVGVEIRKAALLQPARLNLVAILLHQLFLAGVYIKLRNNSQIFQMFAFHRKITKIYRSIVKCEKYLHVFL
jgi:hypothetical protein